MKIITAGGREFKNSNMFYDAINKFIADHRLEEHEFEVVSGDARGADAMGKQMAIDHKLVLHLYPAQWHRLGKRAGYDRNVQMVQNADALIAFWDGESRGTAHMIDIAKNRDLIVVVIRY